MRKRGQDRGRRDVVFQAGDEVLLDTTFTPLPSRCLLTSSWQDPFKVIGPAAGPNTYQIELSLTWWAHNEFNVDRLQSPRLDGGGSAATSEQRGQPGTSVQEQQQLPLLFGALGGAGRIAGLVGASGQPASL